ncbi:hypothetical protein HDU98_005114, partial [Podochytrium sp. JEL0797]
RNSELVEKERDWASKVDQHKTEVEHLRIEISGLQVALQQQQQQQHRPQQQGTTHPKSPGRVSFSDSVVYHSSPSSQRYSSSQQQQQYPSSQSQPRFSQPVADSQASNPFYNESSRGVGGSQKRTASDLLSSEDAEHSSAGENGVFGDKSKRYKKGSDAASLTSSSPFGSESSRLTTTRRNPPQQPVTHDSATVPAIRGGATQKKNALVMQGGGIAAGGGGGIAAGGGGGKFERFEAMGITRGRSSGGGGGGMQETSGVRAQPLSRSTTGVSGGKQGGRQNKGGLKKAGIVIPEDDEVEEFEDAFAFKA